MEVIGFGEMPPEEKQPIDNTERKIMVTHLKKLLEESVSETSEEWVNAPIRRMTRFQYANAVKDLLELKVKVFPLPEKMIRDWSGYFNPASGKMPWKMRVNLGPLGKSGKRLNVSAKSDLVKKVGGTYKTPGGVIPQANLWLTQANGVGLKLDRFAGSTGMISSLFV